MNDTTAAAASLEEAASQAARGELAQAEAGFRAALAAQPGSVPALCGLADVLAATARADEALDMLARAEREQPGDASLPFKRGHLLMQRMDLDGARAALSRSRNLLPDYAPTLQNLALVEEWSGHFDAALDAFGAAYALDPGNADARFGLATSLLRRRQPEAVAREGWRLYAQGSGGGSRGAPRRRIPARPWDGAPLDGTLLVEPDQGLGDVLQFIRFATAARERVARVAVFVDGYFEPLRPLLASMPAIDTVVDRRSGGIAIAATCLASELPQLVDAGSRAFEAAGPYLFADRARVDALRARVAALPGRRTDLRVGLCWGGNPRPGQQDAARIDARRSIPPDRLRGLREPDGVRFFSLQKGKTGDTSRDTAGGAGGDAVAVLGERLVDWSGELADFGETAALMAALDLVISVDTSVVHAAGATGVPVWMLDRHDNCWRWGSDLRHPGWYETLRVFRQPARGDWDAVIAPVREALAGLARSR